MLLKYLNRGLHAVFARSFARAVLLAFGIVATAMFSLAPRPAQAWYLGADGYYGAVGIDTFIDDFVIIIDAGKNLQHGGGGRMTFGFGRKWITELSVGVQQGQRYSLAQGVLDSNIISDFLRDFVQNNPLSVDITALTGGTRVQTPQIYGVISLEGRYHVLGEFAYDPDVPNDVFFGVGGDWHVPSFWEGTEYLSAIPSLKLIGGYSRRITRSIFIDMTAEIFVVPTPPSNLFNLRLGVKYAF